jgi:hypothetical protein
LIATALLLIAQLANAPLRPAHHSLDEVFSPNAPVCVRFDARGIPTAALVNGSASDRDLNLAMLELLRKRHWDVPPKKWIGRWIALSVAPNGYPVPEILPTCPKH